MARSTTGTRHRAAAVGERPHRRQAPTVGLDHVEDAVEHRRHDHGVGDRLLAHEPHPLLGVEALELHDPPARVGGGQHRGHGGDVVRRDADDGRLVLAGAPELERVHEVRRQVQVAEHRGLRLAGGAAREQQDGGGVGVAAPPVGLLDRLVADGGEELGARRRPRSRRRRRGARPRRRRRSPWRAPPARRSSAAGRRPGGSSPARTACRRWPSRTARWARRASSRRPAPRGRRAGRPARCRHAGPGARARRR